MEARLYLIATPRLCKAGLCETVAAAIDGGVDLVQLRDKDASDAVFLRDATDLAAVCRERGVPLVLNDRVHLVFRAGAEGVHVGEDDLQPEEVRALLGDEPLVGLSTHDRAEATAALARGASYVGIGPVFATDTKVLTRRPGGVALLQDVLGATDLPVFPVGGIHAGNVGELTAAGAERIAVSSAICAAADPRAAAAELLGRL